MAQSLKKICTQKPMSALLDEIRVIKNIVDFRISAVESKIDLLISTCSSIFSNSEFSKSQQKGSTDCLNNFGERFLSKLRDIEELVSAVGFTVGSQTCKNCGRNGDKTALCNPEIVLTSENQLKLNTAEDFPNGCWLGNELDPQLRVRVNIDPALLLHINEQSVSPEKMALALVDSLFPRDVLAVSNLSGKGRHSKQQLDPLLIYGVKCHLKHKFNISELDWFRIKRNIDSKCRTIWRRKKRELSLGDKANCNIKTSPNDFNDFASSDECNEPVGCYKIAESQKVNDIPADEDIQLSIGKTTPDDDFHLLPSVQLFTVEAADCFMLQGHELVIPEGIIKDVGKHSDFLNK